MGGRVRCGGGGQLLLNSVTCNRIRMRLKR